MGSFIAELYVHSPAYYNFSYSCKRLYISKIQQHQLWGHWESTNVQMYVQKLLVCTSIAPPSLCTVAVTSPHICGVFVYSLVIMCGETSMDQLTYAVAVESRV